LILVLSVVFREAKVHYTSTSHYTISPYNCCMNYSTVLITKLSDLSFFNSDATKGWLYSN
jgi:hypothetical protein